MPLVEGGFDVTSEQMAEIVRQRIERDSERCRKAFTDWYLTPGVEPPEHIWQMGEYAILQYNAWQACWHLLRPEEVVKNDFKGG